MNEEPILGEDAADRPLVVWTDDRAHSAKLILDLGFLAALLPAAMALGSWLAFKLGVMSWWTAYGQVLIGDGVHFGLALQAAVAAIIAAAAGLWATLWAGPQRFYSRAMLNVVLAAVSVAALVVLR